MYEDKDASSSPSQNNEFDSTCSGLLRRAVQACAAGDEELGLHLYLAAYEKAVTVDGPLDPDAAFALRKAWMLAIKHKERSLAEHIFEKMEPMLEPNELAVCASQLQNLALEKLEEFGLSREDLEEMTDLISQDFLKLPGSMRVEHMTLPSGRNATIRHEAVKLPVRREEPDQDTKEAEHGEGEAAVSNAQAADASASEEVSDTAEAATPEAPALTTDEAPSVEGEAAPSPEPKPLAAVSAFLPEDDNPDADADAHAVLSSLENLTYHDRPGYDRTV